MSTEGQRARSIPTLMRMKHSQLLSYPIGAEVLSRALDGTPHFLAWTCSFVAGPTHLHPDKDKILVLSASYRKRARTHHDGADAAARGVFEPRWEIWVYTVPRAQRALIKQALIDIGLPNMLRPWIDQHASISGKTGSVALSLEYDLIDKVLHASRRTELEPDTA